MCSSSLPLPFFQASSFLKHMVSCMGAIDGVVDTAETSFLSDRTLPSCSIPSHRPACRRKQTASHSHQTARSTCILECDLQRNQWFQPGQIHLRPGERGREWNNPSHPTCHVNSPRGRSQLTTNAERPLQLSHGLLGGWKNEWSPCRTQCMSMHHNSAAKLLSCSLAP
jgi:hypothetical protein